MQRVWKGEVEDVEHWLLRCEKWKTHRQPLIAMVQEHYMKLTMSTWLLSYYILHAETIAKVSIDSLH